MNKEEMEQRLGLVVIGAAIGAMWLIGEYWYVLIPVALAGGGFQLYIGSTARKERAAKRLNDRLYAEAVARLQPSTGVAGAAGFAARILDSVPNLDGFPDSVRNALTRVCVELYGLEPFEPQDIPRPPPLANSMDGARYRDRINSLVQKFDNGSARIAAEEAIATTLWAFLKSLPKLSTKGDLIAEVPLAHFGDIRAAIHRLSVGFFREEFIEHRLFESIRVQLNRNVYEVSGYDFDRDDPREDQQIGRAHV